jgi:hypothetical protein
MPHAPGLSMESIPLDAQSLIAADLPCIHCGYNLRAQPPSGVCPECATPVMRSMRGDFLRFSDPDWLGIVTRGMNWLTVAIVVTVVTALAQNFLARQVRQVVTPGLGVLWLYACWLLTTPDPRRIEAGLTARQLVRIAAVLSVLLAFTNLLGRLYGYVDLAYVALLSLVTSLVWWSAGCTYVRQLALRIPDQRMAGRTRIIMWLPAVCIALLFIAALIAFVGQGAGVSPFWAFGAMCAFGICVLSCSVASLFLMVRLRRALSLAARQALETWVQEDVQRSAAPAAGADT